MEDARAVGKGLLWFFGAVGAAILAAGVYASVQLHEMQWLVISFVVLIVGAVIVAAFFGSVAVINLALFGPILWLGSRISVTPKSTGTRGDMDKPAKNTICLWYDRDAEDAARFYAKTFPNSSVGAVLRAPGDFPSGKKGDVLTVEFTVLGIPCLGLNGGPAFKHNEAFSFQIATADQAETDRYWNAIVGNGGEESACGWCKDRWGLSWQITPIALTRAIADPNPAAAKRAFDAMMKMKKIDIATIEAARRG